VKHAIIAAALFAGILTTADAQAALITMNFDSLANNASANLDPVAQANGISFLSGFTTDDLDPFGDPIPSETHIEAYSDSDIRVVDPAAFGRAPAPSGGLMVNALFDQLLIRFAAPTKIDGFGFSEDPSSFGDLFGLPILLLDANGKTLADLGPYTPNGNASHRYDFSFGPLTVSQILLSSGSKLYDDISISTSVPEPSSWALMIAGFGLVGASMRRRRSVSVGFAG
jgi:hypothetical protein